MGWVRRMYAGYLGEHCGQINRAGGFRPPMAGPCPRVKPGPPTMAGQVFGHSLVRLALAERGTAEGRAGADGFGFEFRFDVETRCGEGSVRENWRRGDDQQTAPAP